MKCWRDLSKDCAEKDCPMWMTGFDLLENMDTDDLGLNDSMCALTINEKLSVFRQILDMMESMDDSSGLFDDEIFEVMEKIPKKAAGPKIPAVQGAKKKRPSTKNSQGKGKQLPIG